MDQGDKSKDGKKTFNLQTDPGKMQECITYYSEAQKKDIFLTLLGILGTADTIYPCYLI